MSSFLRLPILGLGVLLSAATAAQAQVRPYVGYVYPAGGQQGTTFQIKLGGQGMDDVSQVLVTGKGVSATVVEYCRRLNPQDMQLLREQLNVLKRGSRGPAPNDLDAASKKLIGRIEKRMAEYVNRPACTSIAAIAYAQVTVAPDAEPGEREIRLVTPRGVSNPLPFHVGQLPESTRKAMNTAEFQVLGKEELALRKRPPEEVEVRIAVPCTVNGQIASGEVNRYRFEARKGQKLVISTAARQLVPYIADAVPGWFQPVLAVYDAAGKEVAFEDDYRFKPDPVVLFEVPKDGEYVFTVTDAIFRGREDFVYRVSIGELPFVTSIFPLGGRTQGVPGAPPTIEMKGWNLKGAVLAPPAKDAAPGTHLLAAVKDGMVSNTVPFALDTLPECLEKEPNNDPAHAQAVTLPVIVNGRIDRADDWDVFQVTGRAGDTIVAEVSARRLESPLDSMLKLTDASGKVLALNDDHLDVEAGTNTHHADSYLTIKLPADGTYFVHLGDTARSGGEEYGYRLRISPPQPDFALRLMPSSGGLRAKSTGPVSVYAIRKDGFAGPIKLALKDPPAGFSAVPVTLAASQGVTRLIVKTDLAETKEPASLAIEGRATIDGREVVHEAVPTEDRMQAFLWRHLVPAEDLRVQVFNPSYEPPRRRAKRPATPPSTESPKPGDSAAKPKFTRRQVEGRIRQLNILLEDGLITEEFHDRKVAECEAAL